MGCGPERVVDGAEIMFVKEGGISSTNGQAVKGRFDLNGFRLAVGRETRPFWEP